MRHTALAALVLGLGLALPAAAHAQRDEALDSPRLVRFGIGGGVSVPVNDFEQAFENGYNGQAFVLIRPPGSPLSFRLTGTYNRFDFKNAQINSGFEDGYSQVAGGLANVTLHFSAGPVRPYLLAGLGALNIKTVLETAGGTLDPSETKFAINGGAGLAMRLLGADAFIEARIANVYTDEGLIDTKSIQYVPVTFGIIF